MVTLQPVSLPALREELALHPGPALADGQPSWTLHDPLRNRFFRIDWPGFEILCRWSLGAPQAIADDIAAHTTLATTAEDVQDFALFLQRSELLVVAPGQAAAMAAHLRQSQGHWLSWLLHHYLFFRVPLCKPDGWLGRCLPLVAPLYTRGFALLTLAALALGLVLVGRDWARFTATLQETFNWQGVLGYGLALLVVKTLHEFGHAFTAKRYGCRVPAMGVAVMLMLPVAYTDTNEVWKLRARRQRLAVAGAGVLTELTIAAWATLAWAVLPEGLPKGIAFMLATTTWVATLAINTSPFMRFDGYFLLSDALDMPNLHGRSFALARWHLRERLFGLGLEPPEFFSRARTAALIGFAYATWLYRLVLFLGIALLVYHFFFKLLGVALFAVEIAWFVLLPLVRELREWPALLRQRAPAGAPGGPAHRADPRHVRRSAWMLLLVLGLVCLPWPSRPSASGWLRPAESVGVYAPAGAQLRQLAGGDGTRVRAGDVLLVLDAPELQWRNQRAQARLQAMRRQAERAGVDAAQRPNLQLLRQQLQTAEAELASIATELALYQPRAPFDGVLRNVAPDLQAGQWVAARERLQTLVQADAWLVETYLDEDAVRRIRVGDTGQFLADGGAGPNLRLQVQQIEQDATRVLEHGVLAAQAGGSVLTRELQRRLVPERAVYRVVLRAEAPPAAAAAQGWRGQVVLHGSWEVPALAWLRAAVVVLWRELGF
jgi:putative peptide zinc metalloprotease protein